MQRPCGLEAMTERMQNGLGLDFEGMKRPTCSSKGAGWRFGKPSNESRRIWKRHSQQNYD